MLLFVGSWLLFNPDAQSAGPRFSLCKIGRAGDWHIVMYGCIAWNVLQHVIAHVQTQTAAMLSYIAMYLAQYVFL